MTLALNTFKPLIGISVENTEKDSVLSFILANVEEVILNYCHLEELPRGLTNTAYRMAMDLYRNENIGDADGGGGAVQSISEGDTTVSFRANAYDAVFAESLLKDYKTQLNRYRKLVTS